MSIESLSRHAVHKHGAQMRYLLAFEPLLRLRDKHSISRDYDVVGLGFQILRFVLENMLMATHDCTLEKVASHVRECIRRGYDEDVGQQKAQEIADVILHELRKKGASFKTPFCDYENGGCITHEFRYLEYDGYSISGDFVKLQLTSECLDLLFRSREILEEIKIPINQFFLRQQIQKGVFDEALRTVRELAIHVRDTSESIRKAESRVRSDPGRAARDGDYQRLCERINAENARDQEAFRSLLALVDQHISDREEDFTRSVHLVRRELHAVMMAHEKLLAEKINLGDLQLDAIERLLPFNFRTSFNMQREFLLPALSADSDPSILWTMLSAIMPPWIERRFTIDMITQKQALPRPPMDRNVGQEEGPTLLDLVRARNDLLRAKQKDVEELVLILRMIVNPLVHRASFNLDELSGSLRHADGRRRLGYAIQRIHQIGLIIFEDIPSPSGEDSFWNAMNLVRREVEIPGFFVEPIEPCEYLVDRGTAIQNSKIVRWEAER